jgi:hypothetical protein
MDEYLQELFKDKVLPYELRKKVCSFIPKMDMTKRAELFKYFLMIQCRMTTSIIVVQNDVLFFKTYCNPNKLFQYFMDIEDYRYRKSSISISSVYVRKYYLADHNIIVEN